MHLAAQGKNAGLAFNRLVDLTECYARRRAPETDAAVTALVKSDQSLPLEELEDVGSGATTPPGKYVDMMKRMPPSGGKIPGAPELFPTFG